MAILMELRQTIDKHDVVCDNYSSALRQQEEFIPIDQRIYLQLNLTVYHTESNTPTDLVGRELRYSNQRLCVLNSNQSPIHPLIN